MTTAAEINAALPCQFIDTTAGPYCTLHGGRWIKDVGQCDQRPGLALASAESGDEGCYECSLYAGTDKAVPPHDHPDGLGRYSSFAAAQPEPEPGLRHKALAAASTLRAVSDGLAARDDAGHPAMRLAIDSLRRNADELTSAATPPQPAVEREGLDLGGSCYCPGACDDETHPYPNAAALATQPSPERLREALGILDVIDGIVDDTHPEGDGCPLCTALDDLREALAASGDQGEER